MPRSSISRSLPVGPPVSVRLVNYEHPGAQGFSGLSVEKMPLEGVFEKGYLRYPKLNVNCERPRFGFVRQVFG
jgi:hypothetical protein